MFIYIIMSFVSYEPINESLNTVSIVYEEYLALLAGILVFMFGMLKLYS